MIGVLLQEEELQLVWLLSQCMGRVIQQVRQPRPFLLSTYLSSAYVPGLSFYVSLRKPPG